MSMEALAFGVESQATLDYLKRLSADAFRFPAPALFPRRPTEYVCLYSSNVG
jgi:hypothetical protein